MGRISTKAYYEKIKKRYFSSEQEELAAYHNMRFHSFFDLLKHSQLDVSNSLEIFDFGCGSGEMFEELKGIPGSMYGCDISNGMLEEAQKILGSIGRDASLLNVGGVEILKRYSDKFDLIIALNVLPYLTEAEEADFYASCKRSLKDGGVVIISHANYLFDLFTFNRYTVEFYENELFPSMDLSDEQLSRLRTDFVASLTRPDFPKKESKTWGLNSGEESISEREVVRKRRVDPFEYVEWLQRIGYSVEKNNPINCFPAPPSIIEKDNTLILKQLGVHNRLGSKTLKLLLCSQFQMLLRKTG